MKMGGGVRDGGGKGSIKQLVIKKIVVRRGEG